MEERGPFGRILQAEPPQRRDRTATFIVGVTIVLGIILLILVLPPVSILDDGETSAAPAPNGPVAAVIEDELPAPPEGFEAVSPLYSLNTADPVDWPARITVPLSATAQDGDRLALFTYEDEAWRELGEASVVSDGTHAQGELAFLPQNVAALRPADQSRRVLGSLPAGAQPDPAALDALTTLNATGYVPLPDGQLFIGPFDLAADLGPDIVPTISALSQPEIDNLNAILASPDLRAAHIQALLNFASDRDLAGIDLDYQTIDPDNGDEYVTFIEELSSGLRTEGRTLTIALPLPVRSGGGWDTSGFDWEAIAPAVDAIKLAPASEPDKAFDRTEAALTYLTARVPSSKLLLTISPLSRERSVDGIQTLTWREALTLASSPIAEPEGPIAPETTVHALAEHLAESTGATSLHWDDAARAVAFSYAGPGGERTVWLANAFSGAFKLDLALRYRLGGVAVDDVSEATADADIWSIVTRYAESQQVTLVKPNGDVLQPTWSASGGVLEQDAGADVAWQPPAEAGTYILTLTVSDGVKRVAQQLPIAVQAAAP